MSSARLSGDFVIDDDPPIEAPAEIRPEEALSNAGVPALILRLSRKPSRRAGWRETLGRVALQVFQASTLREALSVLSECEKLGTPVGLLVLELDEGSEEATEVLHCLRQWRNGAELPIFVVSGRNESNWKLRLLGEGANEYFAPPWDDGLFRMQAQQALRTSGHVWRLQQEKQNAERLLQQQKSALATKDVWRLDLASRTLEFNENCREFSGYMPEEIGNALDAWLALVHPMDLLRLGEALSHTDWQGTPEDLSLEFRLRNPQGGWRWILIRGRLEKDELGNPVGLMGSHTDITQAKTTDSITGIPNRFHFDDWLQQNCLLRKESLGVFLFGLDRFHLIRDSLGPGFADHLLRMMGERLRLLSSQHDLLQKAKFCIARIGSDEFALALTGVENPDQGKQIAELIESQLSKGIWIDGKDIFTSISAGYAVRPASADTKAEARDVWRDAEIALHSAKAAGGARTIRFDGAMRERVVEQMFLENELNRAIENWEFEVYYQPKVTLRQQRIIGFEALLRWRHPEKGIIPPSQFIPLAESNGLIVPLGIRTIREACTTIRRWQSQFPQDPPLDMSVNLSVRQFRDSHLIEEIQKILAETGILPSTLQFEVTESVLVDDPEEALRIVERLRSMGVGLKIDDFGTGYSSLSYLHRLPFDCLKIDRSFINSMGKDHAAYEIVRAILSLAENLGLNVVAEGVEHRAQAEELRNMGCQFGQGYWFSPPLTADSAYRMLLGQAENPGLVRLAEN